MIRTVTPIFSIIIAFVVFFFFTQPMFAEIQSFEAQAEQYEEAVARATELNVELAEKVRQKRSYSAGDLEKLDALVPTQIDEVRILADLSEIALRHNMLFGNVEVTNSENDPDAPEYDETNFSRTVTYTDFAVSTISFGLIGTYEQFKSFLADVEKSLVLLEVTEISFTAGEGALQQFEVTVNAYALPQTQ